MERGRDGWGGERTIFKNNGANGVNSLFPDIGRFKKR